MITINSIPEDSLVLLNAWANAIGGSTYEQYLNRTVEQDINRSETWVGQEASRLAKKPTTAEVLASLAVQQVVEDATEVV
jgi:hypothetical protein